MTRSWASLPNHVMVNGATVNNPDELGVFDLQTELLSS